MDGTFVAAVNETLKQTVKELKCAGLCYCQSPKSDYPSAEPPDQDRAPCTISNLTNMNVVPLLRVTVDCCNQNIVFNPEALIILIKFYYASGEPQVITILTRHLYLHPGCSTKTRKVYQELFCTVYDDLEKLNLVEHVLKYLEDGLLHRRSCAVNGRISRDRKKKKIADCFVTDDEPSQRKKLKTYEVQLPDQPTPARGFEIFKFAVEIMRHDFYSKCSQRGVKTVSACIKDTLVGKLFLDFTYDKIRLHDDLVIRLFEIYHHCVADTVQRAIMIDAIELLADCSWFVDSGKLSVDSSLLCAGEYSVSHLFRQYFEQTVFKKVSDDEIVPLIRPVRPLWLRFTAAQYVSKRWQKKNRTGLQSVIAILESALRKIYKQETSSVLKTLNLDSHGAENSKQMSDELLSACTADDVATLRKLQSKTGGIDFQATDQSGCTILHLVAKHGSADCAEFLLGSGSKKIDIDVKDAKGFTPFSYALQNYNTEVFDLFVEYGVTPPDFVLGKTEIDSRTFNSVFYKKLEPELCRVLWIMVDSFVSCFRLRKLLKLHQEYQENDVIADPNEEIDYTFYEQAVRDFNRFKNVIAKLIRIKDCPPHVQESIKYY